jgi:hypothetical protein
VIQIRQIASDFAEAAELRMDGSFEEPSTEGFCVGEIGLVENLIDVTSVSRQKCKDRRKKNVRITSHVPKRHNKYLQSCYSDR